MKHGLGLLFAISVAAFMLMMSPLGAAAPESTPVHGIGFTLTGATPYSAYQIHYAVGTPTDVRVEVGAVAGRIHGLTGITFTTGGDVVVGGKQPDGSITISSGHTCHTQDEVGCTTTTIADGHIMKAAITLIPGIATMPGEGPGTLHATLLHEFGHVVGLTHYNKQYDDHDQIMNATLTEAGDYQSGDLNGLAYIKQHVG